MKETDKTAVADFYDGFSAQQEKIGINSRHLQIIDKLMKAGLKPNHKVLEVGCGIGTVSQLIARFVKKGHVHAVDISPESVAKAKLLWKNLANLSFEVSDMTDFHKPSEHYDFFVFPDVLEHIPAADHKPLFEIIQKHSHNESSIFVHIPDPRFLKWMIANEPEKLQVIDQPLDTGRLVTTVGECGYFLEKMESYSIFYREHDYQYFIFRNQRPIQKITHLGKWEILRERVKIKMKFNLLG
ncbi:class I SAM-dependent methyltransferase [Lunatibacter salilacus]|uniref:class I SAM-dependent methyltransferase n=1 Tax=Lunatibacter salilacus TaxID=2483804 RepID=UPI00131AA569|nr:class I SAM-dependent methyltransferase [Lunatibacter salilacus]